MNIITTIEQDIAAVPAFLKTELGKIKGVVATVETDVESAVGISINVLNAVKTYIASPTGQLLSDLIEAVPGIGPFVTNVLNLLPKALTDLGLVQAEFTKSPQQLVIDGVTAAINSPSVISKVGNLTNIAGAVAVGISELQNAPISMQTALSIIPAKYSALAATVVTVAKAA